jgi:hypothetical protein
MLQLTSTNIANHALTTFVIAQNREPTIRVPSGDECKQLVTQGPHRVVAINLNDVGVAVRLRICHDKT